MRATGLALLAISAVLAAGGARAAALVMPEDAPAHYSAYNSPRITQPWANEQPSRRLEERPLGEVISTRLGLVDGSAELFRYQVQGAPSDKTMLDGVIDGGGIKLKLSW